MTNGNPREQGTSDTAQKQQEYMIFPLYQCQSEVVNVAKITMLLQSPRVVRTDRLK